MAYIQYSESMAMTEAVHLDLFPVTKSVRSIPSLSPVTAAGHAWWSQAITISQTESCATKAYHRWKGRSGGEFGGQYWSKRQKY